MVSVSESWREVVNSCEPSGDKANASADSAVQVYCCSARADLQSQRSAIVDPTRVRYNDLPSGENVISPSAGRWVNSAACDQSVVFQTRAVSMPEAAR